MSKERELLLEYEKHKILRAYNTGSYKEQSEIEYLEYRMISARGDIDSFLAGRPEEKEECRCKTKNVVNRICQKCGKIASIMHYNPNNQ